MSLRQIMLNVHANQLYSPRSTSESSGSAYLFVRTSAEGSALASAVRSPNVDERCRVGAALGAAQTRLLIRLINEGETRALWLRAMLRRRWRRQAPSSCSSEVKQQREPRNRTCVQNGRSPRRLGSCWFVFKRCNCLGLDYTRDSAIAIKYMVGWK